MQQRNLHLVAYDIADPRRLARVARVVSRSALRIQYSVYVAQLAPAALRTLVNDLDSIIDPKADDLRIYPLPRRIDAVWYGKPVLIDGVLLGGAEWTRLTMPTPGVYLGDVPAAGSDRDE